MTSLSSTPPPARFGFIGLEPGVRSYNMWAVLYASFVNIGLATTVAVMTPYLLSANLDMPLDQQGTALGILTMISEIGLLFVFVAAGILADRVGRRAVYTLGFIATAVFYVVCPLATNMFEMSLARLLYAVGIGATTGMLSTVLADYVKQKDRGKSIALTGILNGLGIICLALVIGRLPAVFVSNGMEERLAGQAALGIAAVICVFSAFVTWFGLRPGLPTQAAERIGLSKLLTVGFTAAKENPRITLAYASAFVARGDMAIVAAYAVAWGKIAALENGASLADALDQGRIPFIIAQAAALSWAAVVAIMIDRSHRITALAVCMLLGAAGYLSTLFISNPLAGAAVPFFILLGIGQISAFIGSQSLIGKEAPEVGRGAVMGFFNLSGAFGILVLGTIAGVLFDKVGPQAPFVLVGSLNLLVGIGCVALRLKTRKAETAVA